MPSEPQTMEEKEEMQEEMVLLVKGEEDEGEKYEVVKLKIPMDNKEVRVPHSGAPFPLTWFSSSLHATEAGILSLRFHESQV